MLTKRENMLRAVRGGEPDRFVNQYEALRLMRVTPHAANNHRPSRGGVPVQDSWGVWRMWPEEQPGPWPMHDPEHVACADITKWSEYVSFPRLDYSSKDWEQGIEDMETIDRSEQFATISISPGIFEQMHHLQGVDNALVNYLEEPECSRDLVKRIAEWELKFAEQVCKYLKPDAVFHHDDWGTQNSTFLSPDLFCDIFVPAYKEIYGYYKDHGVELIVHHSDSYAATLVPAMIEMGIDVWQGCMRSNDIPRLLERYEGEITIMGGIDSADVDRPDWTPEAVRNEVKRACEEHGPKGFIPCITQGTDRSIYPGVYDCVSEAIREVNRERFNVVA